MMQLNTLSMVHDFLTRTVKPGSICVDATAGKGRDTALLCRLTGKAGRVLAFDIQEEAIRQTRALLEAEGVSFLTDGRVDMAVCRWEPEAGPDEKTDDK